MFPLLHAKKDGDLAGIGLGPEQIERVVGAAQVPLVGWVSLIPTNWLAPYNNPCTEPHGILDYGIRPRGLAPISTTWWCSSLGILRKLVNEREHIDVSDYSSYEFRDDGSLARTNTYDYITSAFVEKDAAIEVRGIHDPSPVSAEVVFAAFAALMAAVDAQQLTLRGLTPTGLSRKLSEIERNLLKVATLVAEPEAKILRGIGVDALSMACKHFRLQIRDVRGRMRHYPKQAAARIACIGPLYQCFTLLFGSEARRDRNQKMKASPSDAQYWPFVRFAVAFFEEMQCPCTPNTVKAAVGDWRANRARPRKRKVS